MNVFYKKKLLLTFDPRGTIVSVLLQTTICFLESIGGQEQWFGGFPANYSGFGFGGGLGRIGHCLLAPVPEQKYNPLHTNLFPQDYFSSPFIQFCTFDIVFCVATLGIDAGLLWEPSQRYKNMAKDSSSTSITPINQLLDDFLWAVVPSLLLETLLNMSSSKLLWYSHHPHLLPKKWNTVKSFLTEKCLPASNLFQTRTSGEVGTLRHRIIVAWIFPELTIF